MIVFEKVIPPSMFIMPVIFGSKAYLELSQTSKMEFFAKIVHGFQPLIIFAKSCILDVWLGSEYAWVVIRDIRKMGLLLLAEMIL